MATEFEVRDEFPIQHTTVQFNSEELQLNIQAPDRNMAYSLKEGALAFRIVEQDGARFLQTGKVTYKEGHFQRHMNPEQANSDLLFELSTQSGGVVIGIDDLRALGIHRHTYNLDLTAVTIAFEPVVDLVLFHAPGEDPGFPASNEFYTGEHLEA